jgi:hypothetical protein
LSKAERVNFCFGIVLAAISLFFCGCASVHPPVDAPREPKHQERNSFYSLLYDLASKESDVDKILLLKHPNRETAALIREIARTYQTAKHQLEHFAGHDPSIHLKETQLPSSEQKTRDAIDSAMSKRLLAAKHADFETLLLLSQAESLRYATYLAKEAHKVESDNLREDYLDQFAKQCEQLYEKVLSHFATK